MSVEEAKLDLMSRLQASDYSDAWVARDGGRVQPEVAPIKDEAAIDRLILEVRAEMPCSNYYVAELQDKDCEELRSEHDFDEAKPDSDYDWPPKSGYERCPSCQARSELAVKV